MSDSLVGEACSLESLVGRLADEFLRRQEAGERPDVEEYVARCPQAADLLRKVLASLQLLQASLSGSGPRTADACNEPAGTLGDFRLIREVGRGGMGIVYEAEQISLGRRVALKVLPLAATMDPRRLQRFHNEARAAAGLHHTNIVPVYGVGCERGVHYYAMQFIEGRTLADYIAQQCGASPSQASAPDGATASTPTTPPAVRPTSMAPRDAAYFQQVAGWGIQAAEALDCAHQLGVLHRDVKPANLMVDAAGRLWVTDFGLAQVQSDARLTMTGDLVGTLRYMSPEQALAKRVVIDHRTDVYSLGTTLYELLTLRPAYTGNDREELLRQIAFEEPSRLRQLNKAIPTDLETIVLKAMEKDPTERYTTAKELADDLRRWLEDRVIQARRPSFRQVAMKWARRHRTAVTAAVVCLLVSLATLSAGLAWHNGELRDAAEREHNLTVEANGLKEDAKQKRASARRAADRMYMQVAEKWMTSEPGTGKLQREFLEEALRFYQELVEEPDDDPTTQKELANAYRRMGEIHLKLGQRNEATQDLGKAVDLAETLVTLHPDQDDYADDLASIYYQLGNLNRQTSHPKESEAFFRRSLDIRRKLAARPRWTADSASSSGRPLSISAPYS